MANITYNEQVEESRSESFAKCVITYFVCLSVSFRPARRLMVPLGQGDCIAESIDCRRDLCSTSEAVTSDRSFARCGGQVGIGFRLYLYRAGVDLWVPEVEN